MVIIKSEIVEISEITFSPTVLFLIGNGNEYILYTLKCTGIEYQDYLDSMCYPEYEEEIELYMLKILTNINMQQAKLLYPNAEMMHEKAAQRRLYSQNENEKPTSI